MPDFITIRTARNVEIEYRLASVGDRILGRIIDSIILFGYLLILGFFSIYTKSVWLAVFLAIPALFYSFIFERLNNGQTPGKNIMQMRVISLDGANVTTSMYFLRWLLLLVDKILVNGVVGLVAILASENSQRLGDMTAGTAVISLKKSDGLKQSSYKKINPNYSPSFEKASMLNDTDIQTLQMILKSKAEKKSTLVSAAASKVEDTYGLDRGSLSSGQFLRTIINDFNYYEYHAHLNELGSYEEKEDTDNYGYHD